MPKLYTPLIKFGRQLLETNDLDPVYVVLYESDLKDMKLARWLLAYWCFYHMGTASWITDGGKKYWDRFLEAAGTKNHLRSSERRHFRGQQALKATQALMDIGRQPFAIIDDFKGTDRSLVAVMSRVKKLRGFGDWIAFKVADMLERLNLYRVDFKVDDIFNMFDAPRKGAELAFNKYSNPGEEQDPYLWSYKYIMQHLGNYPAPPGNERLINIQEVETILCKWKSHMNGHYTIPNDISEIHKALEIYKKTSSTAKKLIKAGAKGGLW